MPAISVPFIRFLCFWRHSWDTVKITLKNRRRRATDDGRLTIDDWRSTINERDTVELTLCRIRTNTRDYLCPINVSIRWPYPFWCLCAIPTYLNSDESKWIFLSLPLSLLAPKNWKSARQPAFNRRSFSYHRSPRGRVGLAFFSLPNFPYVLFKIRKIHQISKDRHMYVTDFKFRHDQERTKSQVSLPCILQPYLPDQHHVLTTNLHQGLHFQQRNFLST